MIEQKEISKEFGREAIKSRMIDLAATLHGYEQFELESFDPLVDLMLSGLAKELEKSHLFFQDTFDDLCSHLIRRLIPESEISFFPSQSIVHIETQKKQIIDANNLSCTVDKEQENETINLSFVPLIPFTTSAVDVKLVANGTRLIQYNGIHPEELSDYQPTGSSIYLGLKIFEKIETPITIPIYFTWFDYPKTEEFLEILNNSEWKLDGQELAMKTELLEMNDNSSVIKFWDKSYFKQTFSEILTTLKQKYFRITILPEQITDERNLPEDILNMVKQQPELSFANELQWVEIKLPHLKVCKELGLNLFAQTNCFPAINLKEQFETHKVRNPYKVFRISGDEFFVDVKKLYNYNEGEYLPKYNFQSQESDIQGYYKIARNSIIRIDKRVAVQKIVQLIDIVREERNAFSSFNPDWIISELEKIKINFQRIEYKLGENLNIKPHDVFISLEDQENDTTIRVEYWTCNGENANDVPRGSESTIVTDLLNIEGNGFLVEKSVSGRFTSSKEEKIQNLRYQLQTQDRIVTRADLNTAINFKLSPIKITNIEYETQYQSINGVNSGYSKFLYLNIELELEDEHNHNLEIMSKRLQDFIDERIISELRYIVKLNAKSDV